MRAILVGLHMYMYMSPLVMSGDVTLFIAPSEAGVFSNESGYRCTEHSAMVHLVYIKLVV